MDNELENGSSINESSNCADASEAKKLKRGAHRDLQVDEVGKSIMYTLVTTEYYQNYLLPSLVQI